MQFGKIEPRGQRSNQHSSFVSVGARYCKVTAAGPVTLGETFAGGRAFSKFVSAYAYPIFAPAPILFSAIYLVGTEFMDEKYRRFFQTEADVAGLDWAGEAFYHVYSRYFADEDYYLDSPATGANLRAMIQTIEIADDDLEMSWADFIQFQTGYPLRVDGAEILSFRIGRAKRMGTYTYDDNVAFNHFGRTFGHSIRKNHLLQQGGCLIHVAGNWSNPLLDAQDAETGFDINELTNRDDWMIKTVDSVADQIGKLSATDAAINLFYGGDIYVPAATHNVSNVMTVSAGDVDTSLLNEDIQTTDTVRADATGNEVARHIFYNEFWMGASYLSGITFI